MHEIGLVNGQNDRRSHLSEGLKDISDILPAGLESIHQETDYVDFLQLHNPDADTFERMKLLDLLLEFKKAGVVRFIGCSTTLPHIKTYIKWDVFDILRYLNDRSAHKLNSNC